MLNTKRLLSLFVVVLMIGTVSLTTFNSSSNTCVSYADDEGLDDVKKAVKEVVVHTAAGAAAGAAIGAVVGGPAGAATGAVTGAVHGAVSGVVTAAVENSPTMQAY